MSLHHGPWFLSRCCFMDTPGFPLCLFRGEWGALRMPTEHALEDSFANTSGSGWVSVPACAWGHIRFIPKRFVRRSLSWCFEAVFAIIVKCFSWLTGGTGSLSITMQRKHVRRRGRRRETGRPSNAGPPWRSRRTPPVSSTLSPRIRRKSEEVTAQRKDVVLYSM